MSIIETGTDQHYRYEAWKLTIKQDGDANLSWDPPQDDDEAPSLFGFSSSRSMTTNDMHDLQFLLFNVLAEHTTYQEQEIPNA